MTWKIFRILNKNIFSSTKVKKAGHDIIQFSGSFTP